MRSTGTVINKNHQCAGFDYHAEVGKTHTCTCGKKFVATSILLREGQIFGVTQFTELALANA